MKRIGQLLAVALIAMSAGPAAAQDSSQDARTKEFAKLPDWSGLWLTEGDFSNIGGLPEAIVQARKEGKSPLHNPAMALFGFAAPWNEEGLRRQKTREGNGNRTADGWGFPLMMNAAAPIQFFITPDKVLIINGYRDVTDVRLNQDHPSEDDLWPTVWGDSVGHWEGDTLVIDTIEVKNPNIYFHGAPPLSDDAHYVQRIRMDRPGHLTDEITITDPATLTKPWVSHLSFVPAEGFGRMVYDNFDNDRTDSEGATIKPPQDELPTGADTESYHQ